MRRVYPSAQYLRLVCFIAANFLSSGKSMAVSGLQCESQSNPLGIGTASPNLSWTLESGRQTAYQVEVDDGWDSGKVTSAESTNVAYAGAPLESRRQYSWKVRVWDEQGKMSPWSQEATWTMGILDSQDWDGHWIAARDVAMNLPLGQRYSPGENLAGNFNPDGGLGYQAAIAANADTPKWVEVDLGAVLPIETVRIRTLDYDDAKGFGFPLRYRLEASDTPNFSSRQTIEDQTQADVFNPGEAWIEVNGHGVRGRYVRLTATRLFASPKNPARFCFALRKLEVISNGVNAALRSPVTALDSVESTGWGKSYLTIKLMPKVDGRREAVLMRRDVDLLAKPVRAIVRTAGLGFADLSINGHQVGNRVMAPALTDYTKRVYYDTYDVTDLLRAGTNTLGAVLGNGYFSTPGRGWGMWYGVGNEPVLALELELSLPDGTQKLIGTDNSWKWSTGEITFNDFFVGETQDLRLAQQGWDLPGFDDGQWKPVVVVTPPPGVLQPNPCPPVRVCEVVKPIRVTGNSYIFDGMYSGWPCIKVRGSAGQVVTIGGSAKYKFILKGGGEEMLQPRFVVQSVGPVVTVDGIAPLPVDAVTLKWVHAGLRKSGEFSCSNSFLNQVYAAEVRTHLNYTYDFPMDPTREKSGWTQDVQTMFDSAAYMTDMAAVYHRWWVDFRDSQTLDGAAGSVAPMVWGGQEHIWDDPWWSGMIVYTPWKLCQFYGDKRQLADAFGSMQAYLDWLTSKADADGIMRWSGASDWIEVGIDGWGPPKRTPRFLVSTCGWYLYADIVSRSATILGKTEDAQKYATLAKKIRDTLNAKYFDPATGLYANATDSQTALILPLCLGMVPEGKQSLVIQRLVENIHQWKDHLSTGFVGTPYLLEGLPDFGLAELSYKICTQQDYASWKTLISDGVLKETWRGGMAQMPSLGGPIGGWFYRTLAGIRPDAPGFRKILIKPAIVGDLTWVKCWHDCVYGRIISNWQLDDKTLTMDITIPANTTATVCLPDNTSHEVGPGNHEFKIRWPQE